jgi:hypothetical protein
VLSTCHHHRFSVKHNKTQLNGEVNASRPRREDQQGKQHLLSTETGATPRAVLVCTSTSGSSQHSNKRSMLLRPHSSILSGYVAHGSFKSGLLRSSEHNPLSAPQGSARAYGSNERQSTFESKKGYPLGARSSTNYYFCLRQPASIVLSPPNSHSEHPQLRGFSHSASRGIMFFGLTTVALFSPLSPAVSAVSFPRDNHETSRQTNVHVHYHTTVCLIPVALELVY